MILILNLRPILNSNLIMYEILQKTYKTLISDASSQSGEEGVVVFRVEIGNNHSKPAVDF